MAFDIEMIKRVYSNMADRVDTARKVVGRPLTLSEKILYNHLWESKPNQAFTRGVDYVDFDWRCARLFCFGYKRYH